MTDSPFFRNPTDPKEQPILDELVVLRDKLLLLKQDKTQYIKSQDVITLYEQIIEQVHGLNDIRATREEHENRVDYLLDDCFALLSLFFMTIGRNNEAPASYAVVSTIKRLTEHLREAGFYANADLQGLDHTLSKVREQVEKGKDKHSPHLVVLLEARINTCYNTLAELRELLAPIPEELMPTHEKLVSILRSLSGLNTKAKFPVNEVKEFQKQLREIEADLAGRKICCDPGETSFEEQYAERLDRIRNSISNPQHRIPHNLSGRDVVLDLLVRCLLWVDIILQRQGKIDERFKETFDKLLAIRNKLDKLSLTRAWSLRETDLYSYQRQLDRIDEARVHGNFIDAEGNPSELYEQRTLLYLLRKSYANVYFMITSSEPVSEALLPIYNQLMTLRRCLAEVKRSGGVSSPRELYPYSMKLHSIDNMRSDGKFVVNGDIPEGQGSVTELLSECFEMAYELRNEAESDDEGDSKEAAVAGQGTKGPGDTSTNGATAVPA